MSQFNAEKTINWNINRLNKKIDALYQLDFKKIESCFDMCRLLNEENKELRKRIEALEKGIIN